MGGVSAAAPTPQGPVRVAKSPPACGPRGRVSSSDPHGRDPSQHRSEKNFQTQSIAEGSEFIKNKEQRQCGHWEHGGRALDPSGRADGMLSE